MLIRFVLFAALLSTPLAASAADFQWHGEGDLGAALESCRKISGRGARTIVLVNRHRVRVRDYGASYDTSADAGCMQSRGFVRDTTLTEPAENPQYVAYYEQVNGGIQLRTRAQSLADERAYEQERAERAAAKRAQEDALLERCAGHEATVGDLESCAQIKSFREHGL